MDAGAYRGTEERGGIGRATPRREDAALVQGRGRFVDDLAPAGTLVLEVLRSPVAGGRIAALELAAAREAEGVVAVFAAGDLGGLGEASVNRLLPGATPQPFEVLARGTVKAVGQPVAAVVATSAAAARDAVEAIVLDVEGGAEPAPAVEVHRWTGGEAVSAAAAEVTATVRHALLAPMPLEPRAALAEPVGEGLRVWLSTQTPFRARDDLATILGLPREAIHVIAPDVGGAFGGKASIMPEDVLTAFAARTLRRPVKWTASRSDDFLAATQGRGATTTATLSLAADGRFLALSATIEAPLGHFTPYSAFAPVRNAGRILPGPYLVEAVDVAARVRPTAGAAVNIYRGAGRPEAAMLMERLADRAARATGLDPLEIRRRNLRPADTLPGPTLTGEWLDTGDYAALLDRLEAEADYAGRRAGQARRRAAGEVVGLGLALYVEPCGQGWETARVSLGDDGRFVAATGSTAQGQGRETAAATIVAAALGVASERVAVAAGDTGRLDDGIGALASRSTAIGGSALDEAARRLLGGLTAALAARTGAAPETIAPAEEGLLVGNRLHGWAEIARDTDAAARTADARFTAEREAWASGAMLAAVAIDRDTGVPTVEDLVWVDDAGVVVNPLLVEGQLRGGLAQGIGHALMERMIYDGEGQLLTGSLMDYAVPRASDMPARVRLVSQPTPSAANPLGAKGVGEAGTIAAPAAILNALADALLPFTDADLALPVTSETLWRIMNSDGTA